MTNRKEGNWNKQKESEHFVWSGQASLALGVSNHLSVVLEGLVRRAGEVEVEPRYPPVVAADDQVVPRRVDIDAADPLASADQLLHQHLVITAESAATDT